MVVSTGALVQVTASSSNPALGQIEITTNDFIEQSRAVWAGLKIPSWAAL